MFSLLEGPSDPDPSALQEQDERFQKTYKTAAEINNDVDELQSNIQSLIQSLGIDPMTLDSSIPPTDTGPGVGGGGGGGGGGVPSAPAQLPTGDVDMFAPVNMAGQDFDFDAFLMDMPRANEEDGDLDKLAERLDASTVVVPKASDASKIGGTSSEQLHAFLDEVASQDGNARGVGAGVPQLHRSQAFQVPPTGIANCGAGAGVGPGTGTMARGRKRKSDMMTDAAHSYMPPEAQGATTTTSVSSNRSKRKR